LLSGLNISKYFDAGKKLEMRRPISN